MKNNISIGIFIAVIILAVYIIKEKTIPFVKQVLAKRSAKKEIYEIMDGSGLSLEQAQDQLILNKLAQLFKTDQSTWEINGLTIKHGDRIGFGTTEDGFISGEFFGLKTSQAEGYSFHFMLLTTVGNGKKVVSKPVEVVQTDTVSIYNNR